MKFTIFVDPSLVITTTCIYMYMSSDLLSMPRSRDEENFKKHINTFYRKLSLLEVGGHEIRNKCYIQNLGTIDRLDLEKKIVTDDGQGRTPTYSNWLPE